ASWRTPLAIVGVVIALAWVVIAIFAPWLAPHAPLAQAFPRLTPPGESSVLGTDALGRDVFSRLLAGARVTMPYALLMVVCATVIGTLIGAVAGYVGRWVDETLMRLTVLVMAFPSVFLAMDIAASLCALIKNDVILGYGIYIPII